MAISLRLRFITRAIAVSLGFAVCGCDHPGDIAIYQPGDDKGGWDTIPLQCESRTHRFVAIVRNESPVPVVIVIPGPGVEAVAGRISVLSGDATEALWWDAATIESDEAEFLGCLECLVGRSLLVLVRAPVDKRGVMEWLLRTVLVLSTDQAESLQKGVPEYVEGGTPSGDGTTPELRLKIVAIQN